MKFYPSLMLWQQIQTKKKDKQIQTREGGRKLHIGDKKSIVTLYVKEGLLNGF